MRKKIFFKVSAVVACLAILSLSVPNLMAAEKGNPDFSFNVLLKKPGAFLSSLLSFLPIFDNGDSHSSDKVNNDKDNSKVKLTGGLGSGKLSDGD
ncbi:hypothetical protein KGY73_11085 [bacterium]|nr:hypothetical protein [bacterium]